jgi:diguanylate cyclase (GGDEF)-like protein
MKGEIEYSWRHLLGVRSADLHLIADLRTARRVGGIFWLWGVLVTLILVPLAPPDQSQVGNAGWPITAGMLLVAVLYAVRLLRSSRPGSDLDVRPNEILVFDYVAVAFVTILNLLAGGQVPYEEILLLAAIYTAGVFSPRATAVYMVAVAVALAVPLAADAETVPEQVARLVIWSGLAMATSILMVRERLERVALVERGEEAQVQARADPLTGLGNRRAFDEALQAASNRAARTERPLSVIIADIEAFKVINDVYGLDAGDRLLQEVASTLDGAVRSPDACFRWGGDEFVILADVGGRDAGSLGERLSDEIGRSCARPDGRPVRLHVGAAELDPMSDDPEQILGAVSRSMKPGPRRRG